MNYIILDMEWNQPLCKARTVLTPVYLRGEIVQIGAVKLDDTFQLTDTFKIGVRPIHYTKMNTYVKQLTHITDQDLRRGAPFPEAFAAFRDWCGEDFILLTWGYDDIPMLRDNLQLHGLAPEWIPAHYNLQNIYDAQIGKEHRQYSLSAAVEQVGEVEQEAHDALNDAMSTYLVCKHLDLAAGLGTYGESVPGAPKCKRPPEEDAVRGITYPTKQAALKDRNVISFPCPVCGETIQCREWFSQSALKKIALAKCSNGREYFVRLNFLKCKNGRYSAKRMIYELDDYHKAYFQSVAARKPRYAPSQKARKVSK